MQAYWMTNPVSPGTTMDSGSFAAFRNRIFSRKIGEISGSARVFNENAAIALLETMLELVRVTEFPTRPSRWQSLFLWPTAELAIAYHGGAAYAEVYEVQVAEQRNIFWGDFDVVHYYPSVLNPATFMQRARDYWGGAAVGSRREIVLDGQIRIVKQIT